MINRIKNVAKKLPYVKPVFAKLKRAISRSKELEREKAALMKELRVHKTCVPPGHFYSPFPDIEHIKKNEGRIFRSIPSIIPSVNLNDKKMNGQFMRGRYIFVRLRTEEHDEKVRIDAISIISTLSERNI